MSCDVYRLLDGITRNQRGEWVEIDGRPVSPERRLRYGLDQRVQRPGGMPWLREEKR